MKKIWKILAICFLIVLLIPLGINSFVIFQSKDNLKSMDDTLDKYDYILVLGCGVKKNGEPSLMLKDRLNRAIELYNAGLAPKIIITGDHTKTYSEVTAMENYLLANDISENVIIRDDYGYSTSESLINYHKNYPDNSLIIVTQEYHMYRSLYIASKLHLKAVGIPAPKVSYRGQFLRNIREILARNKDFIKFLISQ